MFINDIFKKKLNEGGFDIPEIPRAPVPKPQPPKEKDVAEGSAQDKLHRRHQELRKKSGLPDPDYYKELKASYDIEDDAKRIARQAEIKKKYQVSEAIPYALSAANAAAEYRRQGAAGGGYRGRIDIPVQSREDYLAVGQMLSKAARAEGQKIDYGLSDGVMSIFSDSMTADELDEFIDRVLDQGLTEAKTKRSAYKGSAGAQAIAQASGVKNVNRIVPGQQLNIPGQATPYIVQKGDTLDAIASRFAAPAAAMEPTFTGMAGSELTSRIDGSDPSNPDAKEIRKPRLATSVKNAQRASWGDETSDPAGEVVRTPRIATSVKNAQYAGRIRDPLPSDTDKVSQNIDGQITTTTNTADNTTTTQSMDSTNISAPALNKRLDFVNKEPTNENVPSEEELEWQGREENRFPHFYHHKNNTIFTTPGGDRYDYDDPDQRQRWLDLYKKEFDMPTPHDGGWWRKGPDGDEAMVEQGVAEAVDIGQEWISDTELDQYVPAHLQQQWRELFGYDEDGNPSALWANLTGGYEPDVSDPQHRALMVKVANKWFAAKKIPNVRFFDVKDAIDELEWLVQIGEQGVAEAGPFSYGAKKPRKGSVAYLAAQKRKEQERGKQPIEPKDQMVGTARVIKDVTEGKQVTSSWQITFKDGKKKELKADHEQGSGPSNSQILILAQAQNPNKQVTSVKQQYTPNAKTTKIDRVEKSGRVDWSDRDSKGAYYIKKEAVNEDIERYLDEMHRAGYDIVTERATLCPECGGVAYEDKMLAEKQDACYHKVKSRYKVWPSAYASGALVRCRKKGAKNWGNKSKK